MINAVKVISHFLSLSESTLQNIAHVDICAICCCTYDFGYVVRKRDRDIHDVLIISACPLKVH